VEAAIPSVDTGSGTTLVSVRGVHHEYVDPRSRERVVAIETIDLDVARGEFICILGQSGCGKSTLLYLIAGLMRPTAGEIQVGGVTVVGPGRDRGVVFQEYALLPWKTVRDNIGLGPRFRGIAKAERRAIEDRHVELVGLDGFENKYPHELSGGMRQRVAVARTLAADPLVVLMDEPFASVDAQTRLTLQQELVRIWRETGKTIIFVTHAVDEAAYLADRVVVLTPRPSTVRSIVTIDRDREARRPDEPAHAAAIAHLLALVREGGQDRA
jgi:NitT/TauT family transport system ATP-binding protein